MPSQQEWVNQHTWYRANCQVHAPSHSCNLNRLLPSLNWAPCLILDVWIFPFSILKTIPLQCSFYRMNFYYQNSKTTNHHSPNLPYSKRVDSPVGALPFYFKQFFCCFSCIIAIVNRIPRLWKSSGRRFGWKPEVGPYRTMYHLGGSIWNRPCTSGRPIRNILNY